MDRFSAATVLAGTSFAAFSPDDARIAIVTPRGIEILDRATAGATVVAPPGFTLTAGAWHPDGSVLVASGPAPDGSGPYLHAVATDASGVTRLLPGHPGQARAGCFSPDGGKVAFTYLDRFQHRLAMADWTPGALGAPVDLLPVDPATEPSTMSVLASLAWHETRGFSPDGRRLYLASDRGSGMVNVNLHYIDLVTGRLRHVTREQGVVEGGVLAPDDGVLYYSTTRGREPAYMTLVTGPVVPSFLGFVAKPTLHEQFAAANLAVVGNGDVLAVDGHYGMYARMVGKRERIARRLGTAVPPAAHRVVACSMSNGGGDLAVSMTSSGASDVVLLRRKRRAVPAGVRARATPTPSAAQPLEPRGAASVERRMQSRFGGDVELALGGTLASGEFRMTLDRFNVDGQGVYSGSAAFLTDSGGFRHTADVRRLSYDADEEAVTYYRADARVAWKGSALAGPETAGTLESRSRSGLFKVAYDGTTFAPQDGWRAGHRGSDAIPGARRCRKRRRK